ncbi:hypothetical protein Tco_0987330 [Tanacetum coccineum]
MANTRSLEYGRYGVSRDLDTAYWGFLAKSSGYGVLDLVHSWSLVKCRHRYAVSSLMDTAYWMSESVFSSSVVLCEFYSAAWLTLFDVITADARVEQKSEVADKEVTNVEPPKKKLKFLILRPTPLRLILHEPTPPILTPTPLNSILADPTPPRDPTPPKYESKGKGIATEEPLKKLMPYIEEGESEPIMTSFKPFTTPGEQLTKG